MGSYSKQMFSNGEILDATYVQAKPYGTSRGNLAVRIPKAMPDIPAPGNLRQKTCAIDSSSFANTMECKPNVSKKISTQDWFYAQASGSYSGDYISYGASLKVRVVINDSVGINFVLVPEEADPSFNLDD